MLSDTETTKRRKKLPQATLNSLFLECAYQCSNPRCGMQLVLEVHHIYWLSRGGSDDPSNLIVLCPNCHSLYHKGTFKDEAIKHWKGMLVMLNNVIDRPSIDSLLYLHKCPFVTYSGDGVARFARLIAANFVEVVAASNESGGGQFITGQWQLGLSQRGELFMEAWLEGDAEKYRLLISTPSNATSQELHK